MTDLGTTIVPKSDQLNSDDLISGPRTITITKVSAVPSSSEQPIAIYFEGDDGKPYKPCKSMRRVLVQVWGRDGETFAGRQMTIYRDPSVTWGGLAVGGIRISHMSHIEQPVTMALTASKQARKPFTVKPLEVEQKKPPREKSAIDVYAQNVNGAIKQMTVDHLSKWWADTSQERLDLDIPADRLAKMEAAVQKALNPVAPE